MKVGDISSYARREREAKEAQGGFGSFLFLIGFMLVTGWVLGFCFGVSQI